MVLSGDPDGVCHRLSDVSVIGDYSDCRLVAQIARETHVDSIIPGANDFAAISAASASECLGLQGHDSLETTRDLHLKHRFKVVAQSCGLPVPVFSQLDDSSGNSIPDIKFGFPVLIKPVDLTGGKGISLVHYAKDLPRAVELARTQSRRGEILVESYLTGSHHGVSFLLKNGSIIWDFADSEFYTHNDFLVAGTMFPGTLTEGNFQILRDGVTKLAGKLGLVDGMLHMQVVQGAHGVAVLDVMRRCAGDLYPTFVKLATGFPYLEAVIATALGEALPTGSLVSGTTPTSRHCVIAPKSGTVRALAAPAKSSTRMEVGRTIIKSPGDVIGRPGVDKVEIRFFQYRTNSEMIRDTGPLSMLLEPRVS